MTGKGRDGLFMNEIDMSETDKFETSMAKSIVAEHITQLLQLDRIAMP